MKYFTVTAILLLIAMLQPALNSVLRPLGLAPPVIVAFLLSWATVRGSRDALWATAAGGMILGLFSNAPFGLTLLALLPVVPLAAARELRLLESNFLLALPMLILATLLYFGIMLMGLSFSGDPQPLSVAVPNLVGPGLLGNLLLFAPVYALTYRLARPPRGAGAMWGNSWRA